MFAKREDTAAKKRQSPPSQRQLQHQLQLQPQPQHQQVVHVKSVVSGPVKIVRRHSNRELTAQILHSLSRPVALSVLGVGGVAAPTKRDDGDYHYYTLQLVMLDHTYAVSSQTPQIADDASPALPSVPVEIERPDDDAASVISDRTDERRDSDTETAPEVEEEGKTRCVCDFTHDDGYMICCDRCGEWQHVDCMGIDRQNIPDDYMCDRCQPRTLDKKRARAIQLRKREELKGLGSSASDSSSGLSAKERFAPKKPLTVTTYSNTISGVSRTVPSSPAFPEPCDPRPDSPPNKRGPKRARRIDNGRKGPKRKFPEKRKKKPGDVSAHASKYYSFSSQHANRWADAYESAMTNHYSPELRAKIARYCNNGGACNGPDMTDVLTVHLCTTVPHAGGKILIATQDMRENTPIIELRGKYMLSAQHRPPPQVSSSRTGTQKPGPFLFFYRLPKDSTQICIDTRTYGNEARFVRRSCKPNAELQHCIIKGVLHVYLATVAPVQSNTEISIRHESNSNSQSCACNNPKHCKRQFTPNSANKILTLSEDVERKGRTRLSSSSLSPNGSSIFGKNDSEAKVETSDLPRKISTDGIPEPKLKLEVDEILESDIKPFPIRNRSKSETDELASVKKEPIENDIEQIKEQIEERDAESARLKSPGVASLLPACKDEIKQESPISSEVKNVPKTTSVIVNKVKDDKSRKPMTSRRTSTPSTRTTRASSQSVSAANESADEKSDNQNESQCEPKEKKKMTREERKMEAIMKAFERMEKAELRKQENRDRQSKRRESDSHHPDKEAQDDGDDYTDSPNVKKRRKKKGRSRTTSQNQRNRNRLNSVDSDMITSGEESASLLSPPFNTTGDAHADANMTSEDSSAFQEALSDTLQLQQSVQRLNVGLSSACLLVEAAVGPLESTFKFPKTKKDRMNDWLNKSPDRSYDLNNFNNPSDNNNTSTYLDKKSYMGGKFENLMKAANTMIGNFSGSALNSASTPEKVNNNEIPDPENISALCNIIGTPDSLSFSSNMINSRISKKSEYENFKDVAINVNEKKLPKRYRKGFKFSSDELTFKRSLRSNMDSSVDGVSYEEYTSHDNPFNGTINREMRDREVNTSSQPLQHSAKKRWLRQAISEESDSPTAESPPNEILTPLKKRRVARESLSLEPPSSNCDESQCSAAVVTPEKIVDTSPESKNAIFPQSISLNAKNEDIVPDIHNESQTSADSKEVSTLKETSKIEKPLISSDKKIDCGNQKASANISCGDVSQTNDEVRIIKDNFELSDDGDDSSRSCTKENTEVKTDISLEEVIGIESMPLTPTNKESKNDLLNCHHSSAETSGNSSPVLDDMDDIKKKIHTFHTENIQILKIRNKKQPKESRKKVNLNFDLCVLADQTIGVKLKTEDEIQQDVSEVEDKVFISSMISTDSQTGLKTMEDNSISPNVSFEASTHSQDSHTNTNISNNLSSGNKNFVPVSFTNCFQDEDGSVNSHMPDINVIKNAIDMTASLDIGLNSNNILNSNDEYRNVQEILSRVNQMDSHNSLLLSGVLKDSSHSLTSDNIMNSINKTFMPRANDPRLHPPPAEKPKPIRRKLSITEYRRRHSMASSCTSTETSMLMDSDSASCTPQSQNSPTSDTSEVSKCEVSQKSDHLLDCFNPSTDERDDVTKSSTKSALTINESMDTSIYSDSLHNTSHSLNTEDKTSLCDKIVR